MLPTEVLVAIVTQIGILGAALVAASAARGAKLAAFGAKDAAKAAEKSGGSDHADQSGQLSAIASAVNDVKRDLSAIRAEALQTREEVHDMRRGVASIRHTLNTHLQEKRS